MRTISFALAAALHFACAPAHAQQRAPNPGSQDMLRVWPKTGVWEVVLARMQGGGFGCLMMTGVNNQNTGEHYYWGVRRREERGWGIEIFDTNPDAVSGASIAVSVDGIQVGDYPITRRVEQGNFHIVLAELNTQDGNTVVNLLRNAGGVQFHTMSSTYSASLDGSATAMMNMDSCFREATQIGAAAGQPQHP